MTTTYQGGPYFEVVSNSGTNPLPNCKFTAKPAPANQGRSFDKSVKCYVVSIEGAMTNRLVIAAANANTSLNLIQRYLCFQIFAPLGSPLYFEFGFTANSNHRRLLFSTAFAKLHASPLHTQVPLGEVVVRNTWNTLCFDMNDLCWLNTGGSGGLIAGGSVFAGVDSIAIGPSIKLRKVFTLRDDPRLEFPRPLAFLPSVPNVIQLLNRESLGLIGPGLGPSHNMPSVAKEPVSGHSQNPTQTQAQAQAQAPTAAHVPDKGPLGIQGTRKTFAESSVGAGASAAPAEAAIAVGPAPSRDPSARTQSRSSSSRNGTTSVKTIPPQQTHEMQQVRLHNTGPLAGQPVVHSVRPADVSKGKEPGPRDNYDSSRYRDDDDDDLHSIPPEVERRRMEGRNERPAGREVGPRYDIIDSPRHSDASPRSSLRSSGFSASSSYASSSKSPDRPAGSAGRDAHYPQASIDSPPPPHSPGQESSLYDSSSSLDHGRGTGNPHSSASPFAKIHSSHASAEENEDEDEDREEVMSSDSELDLPVTKPNYKASPFKTRVSPGHKPAATAEDQLDNDEVMGADRHALGQDWNDEPEHDSEPEQHVVHGNYGEDDDDEGHHRDNDGDGDGDGDDDDDDFDFCLVGTAKPIYRTDDPASPGGATTAANAVSMKKTDHSGASAAPQFLRPRMVDPDPERHEPPVIPEAVAGWGTSRADASEDDDDDQFVGLRHRDSKPLSGFQDDDEADDEGMVRHSQESLPSDEVELIYDAVLKLYFNPRNGQYYESKSGKR
eukprot:ANDGO_03435.mRNA.1 hypothetical protein